MINVPNLPPFKRMCVTIGNLPSSFMESMTYYEALCWLYNWLDKTVIPAINTEGEAITELQTAFTTLKNYVDNYFENLDVQDEINNKLDEMVLNGTFNTIINQELFSDLNETITNNYNELKGDISDTTKMIIKNQAHFYNNYGTQIKSLISDLENNFKNKLNIYLVGDSITWGFGANPIATYTPRDGTLSDPRNTHTSPCWANKLMDYLGNYNRLDSNVTYSNWANSPSGESIHTYTGIVSDGFTEGNSTIGTVTTGGMSISALYNYSGLSNLSNFRGFVGLGTIFNYNDNGISYAYLKFNVSKINNIHLGVIPLTWDGTVMSTKISVYLDGNYVRDYTVTQTSDLEISFNNEVSGELEIRYASNGVQGSIEHVYRGGIYSYYLDRTITVYNQGIIGSTINTMKNNVINQGGIANADYVITMVGVNNRQIQPSASNGDGYYGIYKILKEYDTAITSITTKRIYMSSNNCIDLASENVNMEMIRNLFRQYCKDNSLDFIDNYEASLNFPLSDITSDNLHPNNLGHDLIYNNIVKSLNNCS